MTMAAEQGKETRTGQWPALNVERVYSTTVPAEELARALADHFRAKEFETQIFRTSGDRTAMQARKESLWRNLLGVAYALTVVFTPGEGQLSIGLGGHEWVDSAISGAIGLVAVPPYWAASPEACAGQGWPVPPWPGPVPLGHWCRCGRPTRGRRAPPRRRAGRRRDQCRRAA